MNLVLCYHSSKVDTGKYGEVIQFHGVGVLWVRSRAKPVWESKKVDSDTSSCGGPRRTDSGSGEGFGLLSCSSRAIRISRPSIRMSRSRARFTC